MTIFVVMENHPNEELRGAIEASFPGDHLEVAPGQWLISSMGSAQQISERLGLKPSAGLGNTLVFATTSYYGLHSGGTWDWIRAKLEAGQ